MKKIRIERLTDNLARLFGVRVEYTKAGDERYILDNQSLIYPVVILDKDPNVTKFYNNFSIEIFLDGTPTHNRRLDIPINHGEYNEYEFDNNGVMIKIPAVYQSPQSQQPILPTPKLGLPTNNTNAKIHRQSQDIIITEFIRVNILWNGSEDYIYDPTFQQRLSLKLDTSNPNMLPGVKCWEIRVLFPIGTTGNGSVKKLIAADSIGQCNEYNDQGKFVQCTSGMSNPVAQQIKQILPDILIERTDYKSITTQHIIDGIDRLGNPEYSYVSNAPYAMTINLQIPDPRIVKGINCMSIVVNFNGASIYLQIPGCTGDVNRYDHDGNLISHSPNISLTAPVAPLPMSKPITGAKATVFMGGKKMEFSEVKFGIPEMKPDEPKCTCDISQLMYSGCKCGAFKKEQK